MLRSAIATSLDRGAARHRNPTVLFGLAQSCIGPLVVVFVRRVCVCLPTNVVQDAAAEAYLA
eukprot:14056993-Alexandrium_andersonii.AAC.1